MPSYAFLFDDSRGDDLVAYLASLHGSDPQARLVATTKDRMSLFSPFCPSGPTVWRNA